MCGICGIFNYQNQHSVSEDDLRAMAGVLDHRGPDEEGYLHGKNIGLGHKRLKIIDLETGRQPISNEDGTIWVIFNGEIYNFRDLRERLITKGHRFKTQSDTEVIVHLYEEEGSACLDSLLGMFAIALWDSRSEQLLLARDRAGKKPLYYGFANGSILFASEIKALLEVPWFSPAMSADAAFAYFTLSYVPTPQTIFENVYRLPAAHYAIVTLGSVTVKKYWSLDFSKKTDLNEDECQSRLHDLLLEATRIRLISDVPLGAFLSGGLDSSLIVALMCQLSDAPVRTFSIGFHHKDFNELDYARAVSRRYGTHHEEFIVRPDAMAMLPKMIWHYDQPFADSSALPSFYLAELTRKYVTVALNGDGGDENFAGYPRFRAAVLMRWLNADSRVIVRKSARLLYSLLSLFPEGKRSKSFTVRSKRFLKELGRPIAEYYLSWMSCFTREHLDLLLSDDFKAKLSKRNGAESLASKMKEGQSLDLIDQLLYTDTATYLQDDLLVKMDVASMAYSLEARSPLLDHRVMEFAASLPTSLKMRGLTTKVIMKRIARQLLPSKVIHRSKMGFGVPVAEWFQNELKSFCAHILLHEKCRERGIFTTSFVKDLIAQHVSGKVNHGFRLWNLLMFELWCRTFLDRDRDIF